MFGMLTNKDMRIEKLEKELRMLRAQVGEGPYTSFYSYCTSDTMVHDIKNLRRDIDLLLKKHKLCVKVHPAGVTLVKCGK